MSEKDMEELNLDEMDKVSGGSDDDFELPRPVYTHELYPVTCWTCGRTGHYVTPYPESCTYCGMPL